MLLIALVVAVILVVGPFAIAVGITEVGKAEQNRLEAERARTRTDRVVESELTIEERKALHRDRTAEAEREREVRDLFEHGGC